MVAYLNNLEFNFTLTDLNSTVINDFTVGNSTNVTYYGGTSYDFNFPSDVIGYFSANITFTRFGYNSTYWYFNVTVNTRPTELIEELHSLANETTVVVYYHEDYTLSFNLTDVNASAKITESTLPIPVPTGDGLINGSTMFNDNYNFTFYFNVTTDTEFKMFDITIEFAKYGYDNQTFDVHFDVRRRDVTIVVLRESISQDNETEYLVAYLNNLEFNFTLTDLNSTVINDFTVDNSTNVTYYGGTSYDFNFPSDIIGYFSVNITFTRFGYNSTYWYFNVTVNTRPTELIEELYSLANETIVVVYYQEDYTLSFNLTDVNASAKITESTLPMPVPTGDGLINGSIMFNDNYNFTFYFNVTTDTEFKTFDITIVFAKYGYNNQTFDVHFDVRRRDVTVAVLRESISQDNETEYLVAYLNNLEFNFTLTDLNSTVINDFTVDNSTNVTYYGGTSYDFNFPSDVIGYFSANITFTRFGYNSTYWYFNVTVNTRPTELTEELHSLANETTVVVYYQEDYTLSFNLTDVNASVKITESTLPIPVPTGDGLINGS
ncbi:MAG: hypothetical protein ACXAEU_25195, partial [Candidatus Hodarchaeales archaeon]